MIIPVTEHQGVFKVGYGNDAEHADPANFDRNRHMIP